MDRVTGKTKDAVLEKRCAGERHSYLVAYFSLDIPERYDKWEAGSMVFLNFVVTLRRTM
jgi:hypothetical protein